MLLSRNSDVQDSVWRDEHPGGQADANLSVVESRPTLARAQKATTELKQFVMHYLVLVSYILIRDVANFS